MELEHQFQSSNLLVAFQLMIVSSLMASGLLRGTALYQRFVRAAASYVVSFGPMAILIYILYRVSMIG